LQFVRYSLDRQYQKQSTDVARITPGGPFIGLRRSELEYFMQGCAVTALTNGRNNSLPEVAFRKTIVQLLEQLPERLLGLRAGDVGSLSLPLAQRIVDPQKRVDMCANAVRTHGVLELDPSKGDHYKFSHKSFAEALAADVVLSAADQKPTPQQTIWHVLKPGREILSQRVIFSFVRDLAANTEGVSKRSSVFVFQGLMGIRDRIWAAILLSQQVFARQINKLADDLVNATRLSNIRQIFVKSRFERDRENIKRRVVVDAAELFGEWEEVEVARRARAEKAGFFVGAATALIGGSIFALISSIDDRLPLGRSFLFVIVPAVFLFQTITLFTKRRSGGASLPYLAYVYAHMISSVERFQSVTRQEAAMPHVPTRESRIDQLIYFVLSST
jgi:hypothetical protein